VFEVDGSTRTPISPQSVGLPAVVSVPSNGQVVNVPFTTRFFADDDATPNQLEIVVRFRGIETPTPLQISMPPTLHGAWTAITVDNTGTDSGEQTSIALNGTLPSIAYDVLDGAGRLRVASWNGSSWSFTDAENTGVNQFYNPSIALDASGLPRLAYMVPNDYDLKYATYNGSSWAYDPLIDTPGMTGFDCSLVLYNGVPRIAYQDRTNADLKYAYKTGTTWTVTTVEATGNTGLIPSLALDASGNPRIAYHDGTFADLKYASWNGSQWTIEKIDSNGVVGGYASLQLDGTGNPRIAYLDATNHDVKYAEKNGSAWSVESVDLVGSVGQYCALALDPLGNPRISYWDGDNGHLKLASRVPGGWSIETVDAGVGVGSWTSIAIGPNGDPHISYYDITNTSLKYATAAATDYIPPAASTITVAVGRTSAVVSWTSTGDDLNYGTPAQYDVRWSNLPINDGNFGSAIPAGGPSPMKTADEAGNWSPVSNVVYQPTRCSGNSVPFCDQFRAQPATPDENAAVPSVMALGPAQPNPARDAMTVDYEVPRVAPGTSFEISIFDVAGRRVREVARGLAEPGRYNGTWDLRGEDGTPVRHGMYFVRFRLGSQVMNRTAVVLR